MPIFIVGLLLGFIAVCVLAMGDTPARRVQQRHLALVVSDSVRTVEDGMKVTWPTLCVVGRDRCTVVFDAPLQAGDTVYFIPYWENDSDLMRGWIMKIEKGASQ